MRLIALMNWDGQECFLPPSKLHVATGVHEISELAFPQWSGRVPIAMGCLSPLEKVSVRSFNAPVI